MTNDADDRNPLPKYVERENWNGLSDLGDGFYISRDIAIDIGLIADQ
jgi:hypothetical protein